MTGGATVEEKPRSQGSLEGQDYSNRSSAEAADLPDFKEILNLSMVIRKS